MMVKAEVQLYGYDEDGDRVPPHGDRAPGQRSVRWDIHTDIDTPIGKVEKFYAGGVTSVYRWQTVPGARGAWDSGAADSLDGAVTAIVNYVLRAWAEGH